MNKNKNKFEKFFNNNKKNIINKWDHYFEIYDRYFKKYKDQDIVLLEIGVSNGSERPISVYIRTDMGSLDSQLKRGTVGALVLTCETDISRSTVESHPTCSRRSGVSVSVSVSIPESTFGFRSSLQARQSNRMGK